MCASAQYLSKCTEYLSTAVYLNVFCVYVTWTCACIKTKLSPDGSHGAQCLSAAQVPLSVSARQLCLTSISKHKQSCQSQKHCSSVFKSVIIVATRNKILTVYLWLIVLPDHTSAKKLKKKKKTKTHTHSEDRVLIVTFNLQFFSVFFLPNLNVFLHAVNATGSGKNEVKCVSATLFGPHRGSCPPVLSARPSLLSPHLQ